jgi:radical SAM protein with 4Fe4S-binding SPASM domain
MIKSLEFTLTVSKCMGCSFCPQDKLAAAYKGEARVMSMRNFETILGKLPPEIRVDFSGFSECFLNALCAEMIKCASDAGREVHLYTTLSGLTEHQTFNLSRSRIKYVRLHVPDATGFKMDTQLWIRRLHMFAATGHYFTAMAMSQEVDPLIVQALSRYGVALEHPHMLSRAGNLWDIGSKTGKIGCAADRWHQNVCLPNGDVVGDCHDYGLSVPLGNLLTQPYQEIYDSAERWKESDHSNDICAKCEWRSVT